MKVPLSSEKGPNVIACWQPSTLVKKSSACLMSGTVTPVWSWPRRPGSDPAMAGVMRQKASDNDAANLFSMLRSSGTGRCHARSGVMGAAPGNYYRTKIIPEQCYRYEVIFASDRIGRIADIAEPHPQREHGRGTGAHRMFLPGPMMHKS